ncbi:hypothetical protein QCA50_010652 [Cerrena zonata]|uniref:choline-phosphate cytidylyltransferase n=1 Tax=Cerrena zonata TaxID=2478898 RepID=A0AAW0FZC6_9APHY
MMRSIDAFSTLSSDDLADYDVISDGIRSLESSIADIGFQDRPLASGELHEPPPSQKAKTTFGTPAFSAEDIQSYVERALGSSGSGTIRGNALTKPVRVYVDGSFDGFNVAHALQLRQAKLSFPSVYLMAGAYSDEVCREHGCHTSTPHLERCEILRHCRWVDEVVPDAPWKLDEAFVRSRHIDYVAIDEGTSIDPSFDKERLKGYDYVKTIRKAIPTRRTTGVSDRKLVTTPAQTILSRNVNIESNQTTPRITSPVLQHLEKADEGLPQSQENEDPFGEPKVDEFGTGIGV